MARRERNRERRGNHKRSRRDMSSSPVMSMRPRHDSSTSSVRGVLQRSPPSSQYLTTPEAGPVQPIELPGMVFDAKRNRYFRRPDIGRSLKDPFGVSLAEQPLPRSVAKKLHGTKRRGRVDFLRDAEIGRSLPTHPERVIHSILSGGRCLVGSKDWVLCSHGSPAIMLPESVWPAKRSVRMLPTGVAHRYTVGSDINGGSVAIASSGVTGLIVFNGGTTLSSASRCDEQKTIAVTNSVTGASLTFVGSVCNYGHFDLSVFDHENRVQFRRLSAIRPTLGSESTTDVTAMRFGKEERLVPYQLQQPNDSAVNLVDDGAGNSSSTYKSPPLLIGFRCGAISIAVGNYQRNGIIKTNFHFFEPAKGEFELVRTAVSDLHMDGYLLYVSRLGNVRDNLAVYDYRFKDNGPLATFHGHVNAYKYLKFDVAGGVLAAGGDDGCVRLWDARLGGWPLATMRFADIIHDVRIGTTDRHGNGWVGGLWARSAHESYVCGLVAKVK